MDTDLDTLCIAVYRTADDLVPTHPANARKTVTDAELVISCVAQAIMDTPSDHRCLFLARRQFGHLFPRRSGQSGDHKRRRVLADTIEWFMGVFADRSPGSSDQLLLIDSTPVQVRALARDGYTFGSWRYGRSRLLRKPQPQLLGISPARDLRPRRHPACSVPGQPHA